MIISKMLIKRFSEEQIRSKNSSHILEVEPLDQIYFTEKCIGDLNKINPSILKEFKEFYSWHYPFKIDSTIGISYRLKKEKYIKYYCLYFGSYPFSVKFVEEKEVEQILKILNYFMLQLKFNCIKEEKTCRVYSVI